MKIDNISNIYGAYNTKTSSVSKKMKTEAKRDDFKISESAKDFQVAFKAVSNVPDVRDDVVEKVRTKLDAGSYNVTAGMVADKISLLI